MKHRLMTGGRSDLSGISSAAAFNKKQFSKQFKLTTMAKINKNLLVREARGHMGKQFVYRKHGKDTLMTKMPDVNENLQPTEAQVGVRELFAEAALYAKGAISDPELKKQYQKKAGPGRTAYNMAFRDYLKAPKVTGIDPSLYIGAQGTRIIVSAKDDFRVAAVIVRIYTPAGVLLEEGGAILNPVNYNKWIYVATQNNPVLAGSVIRATASDLPGNQGSLEITLP
jgi:hypothetical protein